MNSSIDPIQQAQLQIWVESLRSGQREIADWTDGRLAVSAVPGAGKSTGMAIAAAITIARQGLQTNCQLVLVTFTRSAAANLKSKIRERLKLLNLPMGGFLVTTLHGLAWSIARSYPELSGITDDTMLSTMSQNHRLLRGAVEQWIAENPKLYGRLIEGMQFDGEETERLRRQSVLRTEVLPALAMTVVQEAKKSGLMPDDLARAEIRSSDDYAVLNISAGLYGEYQQQLRSHNWIDYDEMILGALRVLQNNAACEMWRSQVFAVFEDEAQDSSPLQTQLLEILATKSDAQGEVQNLIRVGDPNQAINSTFTPADPVFFRSFCTQCQAEGKLAQMTQAGRSSAVILDAANYLLNWANATQARAGKELPFRSQMIELVPQDDPQPDANPEPVGLGFEISRPNDTYESVARIGNRIMALMATNPDHSAAVLVRTNDQSRFVASELRRLFPNTPGNSGLNLFEVGEEERRSHIPAEMLALLQFCDRPHSPDLLKAALIILLTHKRIPPQDLNVIVTAPEQFLYPSAIDPPLSHEAQLASRVCRSLLKSRIELPLYQLISFFAYTLDYDQSELATTDKLSERLSQQTQENSLGELITILSEVVTSEQFEPVMAESNENRYMRSGQVTIITMHKAKGLDWDYVFIPFLHESMIPGKLYVPRPAEFLGPFTLPEVARAQIRALVHGNPLPDLFESWERAEELKQAEEYRLLYVAMTRAKRLLWMSAATRGPFAWSKPEMLSERIPCPAIPALIKQFPNHVVG
ncbi:MAG: ATP-dependent helicase [Cyanobacteria bacterium]|nr:ATP-dependent helicase [Cyanobacteriota bacterium]